MNLESSDSKSKTSSIFSKRGFKCALPMWVLGALILIANVVDLTPDDGFLYDLTFLASAFGFVIVLLFPVPAFIFAVVGIFLRRTSFAWVALFFATVPIALLMFAIGMIGMNVRAGSNRVIYSYEMFEEDSNGFIARARGGSGGSTIWPYGGSGTPPRDGHVHAVAQSVSGNNATFRIFWPDESTVDVEIALGESNISWDASGKNGIRITIDEIDGIRGGILPGGGPVAHAAVPDLIDALMDKDAEVRGDAAHELRRIGAEQAAVPALVDALNDVQSSVRYEAAKSLSDIGPEAKAAVPALVDALKDEHAGVRVNAAEALRFIGPEAKAAVPALVDALKDENREVRLNAVLALRFIGPGAKAAVPALTEAGKDNPTLLSVVSGALSVIGPVAKDSVPDLMKALRDDEARLRAVAESETRMRVPALIEALHDKEPGIRSKAASDLGRIGPTASAAVPALIDVLTDIESDVRSNAARALGQIGISQIGMPANAAVPTLVVLLRDDDEPHVRSSAAIALGQIGPEAKAAVPDLIEALDDEEKPVRSGAAVALGQIGPEAKASVAALIDALKDRESLVRSGATTALGRIGPDARASVPSLIEAMKNEDGVDRTRATEALRGIGPAAVEPLIESLTDADSLLHSRDALVRIGPPAVPYLIEALRQKGGQIPISASMVLPRIGPPAVPALIEALKHEDPRVRGTAAYVLGAMTRPTAKAAVPGLADALADEDASVRRKAAKALGTIGSEARAAVPSLIEAIQDEVPYVRTEAATALGRIGPADLVDDAIDDPDAHVGIHAVYAKWVISEDRQAEPIGFQELIDATCSDDEEVQAVARIDLTSMLLDGVNTEKIRVALQSGDPHLRAAVGDTLLRAGLQMRYLGRRTFLKLGGFLELGGQADETVAVLVNVIENNDPVLLKVAVKLIRCLGPSARQAVPALIQLLDPSNTELCFDSILALEAIGESAQEAVPDLLAMTDVPDPVLRWAVANAIQAIEPGAHEESVAKLTVDQPRVSNPAGDGLQIIGYEPYPRQLDLSQDLYIKIMSTLDSGQRGYVFPELAMKDQKVRALTGGSPILDRGTSTGWRRIRVEKPGRVDEVRLKFLTENVASKPKLILTAPVSIVWSSPDRSTRTGQ